MVTTSGNLFHIDFGHFLGNIKYIMVQNHFHGTINLRHIVPLPPPSLSLSLSLSPFIVAQGFKREWAPFVLTPDFVWVMGGEVYTAETKIK